MSGMGVPPNMAPTKHGLPTSSPYTSANSFADLYSATARSSFRPSTAEWTDTPEAEGSRSGSKHVVHQPNGDSREDYEAAEAEAKKRKVQRACDICRRKKIRCDGPMGSDKANKCANCQEYGFQCTYVESAKRRGPPKGYIDALENRCARLEGLLQQFHPGMDLASKVGPMPDKEEFDQSSYQETLRVLGIPPLLAVKPSHSAHASVIGPSQLDQTPAASAPSPVLSVLGPSPWRPYEQDPNRPPESPSPDAADASMQAAIAHAMCKLDIKDMPWRFHGKSSPHHLIMQFNELRYAKSGLHMFDNVKHFRRERYWSVPEWELVIANEGSNPVDFTIWPEPGLDQTLIDSYFEFTNTHFPLLNEIIFNRQYQSGLYFTSRDFAKVCLMVFANGARYVDDERVYWPVNDAMTEGGRERLRTDADGTRRYSAGWKYLRALTKIGRSVVESPNLFHFQTQVLTCAFLLASAIPHLTWIVSGVGIRAAQELGIHVRAILVHANPVERALFNRAFWCLYHIDRYNCSSIGRSVAIQDTDFDADYPIAVDDEYWETGNPETDFVQPPSAGLPKVSAFIQTLKLDHIIGAALRTIYAVNRSPKEAEDVDSQRAVVAELDSALNSWADAVPDDLRWDPTRADKGLFYQSAELYVYYYYCQILVHRQFIPTAKQPETIGLPSLAICSNAARSICNIIDAALRRARQHSSLPGRTLSFQFMLPAWVACIVLLINLYTGKPLPRERDRYLTEIKKTIAALKELELTWRQAGKLTDVLQQVAREVEAGDVHFDPPPHGQKRAHEPATTHDDPTPAPQSTPLPEPGPDLRAPEPKRNAALSNSGSGQYTPKTPPPFLGEWAQGQRYTQVPPANNTTTSVPALQTNPANFFDTSLFDPYNAQFGAMPIFEMPTTNGADGDMWAQLFSDFMQNNSDTQQGG